MIKKGHFKQCKGTIFMTITLIKKKKNQDRVEIKQKKNNMHKYVTSCKSAVPHFKLFHLRFKLLSLKMIAQVNSAGELHKQFKIMIKQCIETSNSNTNTPWSFSSDNDKPFQFSCSTVFYLVVSVINCYNDNVINTCTKIHIYAFGHIVELIVFSYSMLYTLK